MPDVSPERIRQVGKRLQLVDVAIHNAEWQNFAVPRLVEKTTNDVVASWSILSLDWARPDEHILYVFRYGVRGAVVNAEGEIQTAYYNGQIGVRGLFHCPPSEEELEEEELLAFIRTIGFAATMPFARQMIASLSSQAGWEALLLPLVYGLPSGVPVRRMDSDESESLTDG